MLYKFKQKDIKSKYEEDISALLSGHKYQIEKIESFAEFQDMLSPFIDCSIGIGSGIIPISFSECEQHCKLLGKDALSYYKSIYDKAKYKWAKRHCTQQGLSKDEVSTMLKDIQTATLPFGSFSIAFKTHRLNDDAVPSSSDPQKMIYYAPLLYDMDDITIDVSDSMCDCRADCIFDDSTGYHQMHIYTDNILFKEDVDKIYPLICSLVDKYNEYAIETYNTFKDDKSYQHREDFF